MSESSATPARESSLARQSSLGVKDTAQLFSRGQNGSIEGVGSCEDIGGNEGGGENEGAEGNEERIRGLYDNQLYRQVKLMTGSSSGEFVGGGRRITPVSGTIC